MNRGVYCCHLRSTTLYSTSKTNQLTYCKYAQLVVSDHALVVPYAPRERPCFNFALSKMLRECPLSTFALILRYRSPRSSLALVTFRLQQLHINYSHAHTLLEISSTLVCACVFSLFHASDRPLLQHSQVIVTSYIECPGTCICIPDMQGLLCREYMMGHSACGPKTEIVLAQYKNQPPKVMSLAELYPFPSLYLGLSAAEQLAKGTALQKKMMQLQSPPALPPHAQDVLEAAKAAGGQDRRNDLHPIRYGAAAALKSPEGKITIVQTAQRKVHTCMPLSSKQIKI